MAQKKQQSLCAARYCRDVVTTDHYWEVI